MSIHILIVDDETNVLKELPLIFTKFWEEYTIHTAHSFISALELLKINTYEVVLLDGMLSGMITNPPEHGFGYNLIPHIRTTSPSATIIMITTDETMRMRGLELGADKALSKNQFMVRGKAVHFLQKDFKVYLND